MESEKPDQRNEEVELNEDEVELNINDTIGLGQHEPFPESYLEFLCETNDEDLQADSSCYGITTDQQQQQTAVTNSPLYSVPPHAANHMMNDSNLFINAQVRLVWLISIKE